MAYIALVVEDVVINKWELFEEVTIMGRAKDCDIQIEDKSVSSKHARIVAEDDEFLDGHQVMYLEDLRSTNGTELNGETVERAKLNDGDWFKLGFTEFQFVANTTTNLDQTSVIVA
jgi:pSer/pThr/pTyr-binding forkhead associated (FHA) protein